MTWFPGRSSSSTHYHRVPRRPSPSRRSVHSTRSSTHAPQSTAGSAVSDIASLTGCGSKSSASVLSSSWSRRARPRDGFFKRTLHRIKRWFRRVFRYARHHPFKVLFLVIVPLLMAGVLQKLLSIVGVHSLGNNLRDGIAKLVEAAQKLLGG